MALRRVGDMLASKYRIEALLGTGGMGDVYRAKNTLVDRDVAIKLLHLKHVEDPDLLERFIREARVANIVRHPNVVDVLDVDKDDDGSPFIVQELLAGEDLAKYLKEHGRLTLDEIRDLVVPIIQALAAAHLQGVIHRDIKPANVFLATERTASAENPPSSGRRTPRSGVRVVPKLLDFGIAKLRSADVRATDVGVILGTPAYMAPELLSGGVRNANAHSDVWSLGVMLFELLAGRRPFMQKAPEVYIAIATTTPPSLADVAPDIDLDVVRVVDRCLRKSLDERFASAAELASELTAALDAAEVRVPTISVEAIPELIPLLEHAPPVVPDLDLPPTLVGSDATIIDDASGATREPTLPSRGAAKRKEEETQEQTERMASAPKLPSASAPPQGASASVPPTIIVASQQAQGSPIKSTLAMAPPASHQPAPAPRAPMPAPTPIPTSAPPRSQTPTHISRNAPLQLDVVPAPPPSPRAMQQQHEQQQQSHRAQQDQALKWLGGVLVLSITSIAALGVLTALIGRPTGWAIVRPFAETTSPQITTAAQVGAAILMAALGTRAFRGALRHWKEAGYGTAVAYAGTCGALAFAALQLARAAW